MLFFLSIYTFFQFSLGIVSYASDDFSNILGTAPQVSLPVKLTLKSKVELLNASYTLDDVAECNGSHIICEEAYGVLLGRSPMPGQIVRLSKEQIEVLVKQEWDKIDLQMGGANYVILSSKPTILNDFDLRDRLVDELSMMFESENKFKVYVDDVKLAKNLKFIGKDFKITFANLFGSYSFSSESKAQTSSFSDILKSFNGTKTIRAVYISGDQAMKYEKEFSFSAVMHVEALLPVAKISLRKGSIIRSVDFSNQWIRIPGRQFGYMIDADLREGYRLKQAIAAGTPVKVNQIMLPLTVRRGHTLSLIIKRKNLKILTKVRALGDGLVGESIDVVSLKSGKRSRVKILDDSAVQLF
ncbi:MAG: flagellar basal body P-ring formation chaperone FlgA [Bdellovibrionota bacterium]